MKKKTKRILKLAITRIIVVAIFVSISIAISTNAMVTNDVALNQLNGGDEAYLMQEIYYRYRTVAPYIGTLIVIWAAMPLFKIIYKTIKRREKNEKL